MFGIFFSGLSRSSHEPRILTNQLVKIPNEFVAMSTNSSRKSFKEPWSIEPGLKRSSDSSSESNPKKRVWLQNIKDAEELTPCDTLPAIDDLHEELMEKSELSETEREKKRKEFKELHRDAFQEIVKPVTQQSEAELQKQFNKFFSKIFENTELKCEDTHLQQLKYHECFQNLEIMKPDFTVVHNEQPYFVYAKMCIELKRNLDASHKLQHLEAYDQLRNRAEHLFYRELGPVLPRKDLWGMITDGNSFYFYKFVKVESGLKYSEYVLKKDEVLDTFFEFLYCYKPKPFTMKMELINEGKYMDFIDLWFPRQIAIIYESSISAVYFLRKSRVLKVNVGAAYHDCLRTEAESYKKIREASLENWPILTLMGKYHDDSNKKSALFFKEKGEVLSSTSISGIVHPWENIVKFLKHLHQLNTVHRDIRPANFVKCEQRLLIIDFGFSCELNSEKYYSGTWITASQNVLEQLEKSDMVKVGASDDLESLLKTIVLSTFNSHLFMEPLRKLHPKEIGYRQQAAKCLREKWNLIKNDAMVKAIFENCWEYVRNSNYNGFSDELSKWM